MCIMLKECPMIQTQKKCCNRSTLHAQIALSDVIRLFKRFVNSTTSPRVAEVVYDIASAGEDVPHKQTTLGSVSGLAKKEWPMISKSRIV
ncbi:hypothetical protein MRB53_037986 [Persea americana]|nr:hypothetical protein MRB53_037986 [Persea americana]